MVTITKQVGNTSVIIHSPSGVITMTPEEQSAWFRCELEKGNPIAQRIVEVASEIVAREAMAQK